MPLMKKYRATVDITFSKNLYVSAETEEEARKEAEDIAYEFHHGEVIIGTDIVGIDEVDEYV